MLQVIRFSTLLPLLAALWAGPLAGQASAQGTFNALPATLGADATLPEREPPGRLAADGQLMAFKHDGFFQPMDTVRERDLLESLWASGHAPWKNWT